MQVICAHCGRRFEAKRSTARYCSDQHRMAAAKGRSRKSNVVPMAKPAKAMKSGKPKLAPVPDITSLEDGARPEPPGEVFDTVDALKEQFRGTTVLRTPLGQVALKLARALDAGKPEGSVAAEVREFRQIMLALGVSGREQDDNPLSRRRRARDRSAAGD